MAKKLICEPRHEDGSYNVKGSVPRELQGTFDELYLCDYYYSLHPGDHLVPISEVYAYFKSQGLPVREKTW